MSLHSTIEPAGTLMTGWDLFPVRSRALTEAHSRNRAKAPEPAREPLNGNHRPAPDTASKWERPAPETGPGSVDELAEIGQGSVAQTAPDL